MAKNNDSDEDDREIQNVRLIISSAVEDPCLSGTNDVSVPTSVNMI